MRVGETPWKDIFFRVPIAVENIEMTTLAGRDWTFGTAEHGFHASAEIFFLDLTVVVQGDNDLARLAFAPGDIKTKIPARTIAARYRKDVLAEHSCLVMPVIDAELRMIDLDGPLAIIDDNETCARINERPEEFQRDGSGCRDDHQQREPT